MLFSFSEAPDERKRKLHDIRADIVEAWQHIGPEDPRMIEIAQPRKQPQHIGDEPPDQDDDSSVEIEQQPAVVDGQVGNPDVHDDAGKAPNLGSGDDHRQAVYGPDLGEEFTRFAPMEEMHFTPPIKHQEHYTPFPKRKDSSPPTKHLHKSRIGVGLYGYDYGDQKENIYSDVPKDFKRAVTIFFPNNLWYDKQWKEITYPMWKYTSVAKPDADDSETWRRNILKTDLLVFCPKEVAPKLDTNCTEIRVMEQNGEWEFEYDSWSNSSACHYIVHVEQDANYWHGHRFMDSIHFLGAQKFRNLLNSYDLILKTDMDVFLTPTFTNWYPKRLQLGKGEYVFEQYTRNRLLEIAKRHDENNVLSGRPMLNNIGSTWFGPPENITAMAALTLKVAKDILDNEFPKTEADPRGEGEWPKWWQGVSSMYASEVAVNLLLDISETHINDKMLDVKSYFTTPIHDGAHIHCYHTVEMLPFSKSKFLDYGYDEYLTNGYKFNFNIVRDYCLGMVLGLIT